MEKRFSKTLKEYVKDELGSAFLELADCYFLVDSHPDLSPNKRLFEVACYRISCSDASVFRTHLCNIYLVRPVGSSVLFAFRHYDVLFDFCSQYVNRHNDEFWSARLKSKVNKLSSLIYSIYTYGY